MTTQLSSPRRRGYRIMNNSRKKTAQEIQDDIFRKMPFERKINLLGKFSRFCRDLSQLRTNDEMFQDKN